ncbi:translation elongation factor (GTPase) [Companilactobacillus paralimentarius DSM 13238 = JCM 10415]|jgi:small GTP-binding protein domain|uniref:Translation elongation factor (GTPase) n=1 Tax=Companilactobacillus paralimentarius DSM 13238 = JCM 10415 TaxID=1122151 RepID=A0A0R1PI33_9LACO|nr:TetM/TetW/TetO/TetS family tetracycline resistance ribosomal protection protein [Companilactobacillus paralimentarius]KAE9564488.1 elongation factor G [Companilactobacillus paralimentarius]KRL31997.1 translation elongation factor (GTPase) [Companilactobacillus paralimentarius DSM 13238 = JCM 10415]QFR69286.1 GTP-binding protein [Companilactobacillus paralimentarius]
MKHIVTGIVAHVDAGKTTLSEALLYKTGQLRKLGRVDNGDAFLDSDDLEKKRGITIFSHQANLQYENLRLTLLDTPGHVDFASQTEQVLSVLDYAILVVSATDGVQGYTKTLWNLLQNYHIPTFIFVNKIDATGVDQAQVLEDLQNKLSAGCITFSNELSDDTYEEIALQNDNILNQFLESGTLTDDTIRQMIQKRQIFPCYFGSALKISGIDEFLQGFENWTNETQYDNDFGAKVFKISHDENDERLTWIKVTGGVLHNKDVLFEDQKANQVRIYNGAKFELQQNIPAGGICAVTGLTNTFPGLGLGKENNASDPTIQPVLTYTVDPKDNDLHTCLTALRQLEDEDPQLHVTWSNQLEEIRVQIMGEVQLEVLQQLLLQRFNLDVDFSQGSILYKETITKKVEGIGHFEPLRHYAEVHLLLEPAKPGSGLTFDSQCNLDTLGRNWQHQVLSNLSAKEHLGVLIGAPITDMKITLISGRASNVHSVGGDFREATWRAVRQGLMMLKQYDGCQLLEPWYQFRLEVEQDQVGRAMNDIQKMNGTFDTPEVTNNQTNVLTGIAPVSQMQGYSKQVRAYTHGQGQLECIVLGYRPCHNADEIIEEAQYQPVSDLENTPDSVFCAHGAGYPVAWDQVLQTAHLPYTYPLANLEKNE